MSLKSISKAGLVTAALAMSLFCTPATYALAADAQPITPRSTVDRDYYFELGRKGATDGTSWQPKDDYSSTYLRVDGREGTPSRLYVDGARSIGGSGAYNCTIGGSVRAPCYTGKYEIHNNVKEWGYSHARLTAWADIDPGTLRGVWSPDCGGNYTDLN